MDRFAVCTFRKTGLDDVRHIEFSRLLGRLEHAPRLFGKKISRFDHPELFDAGNLDGQQDVLGSRMLAAVGHGARAQQEQIRLRLRPGADDDRVLGREHDPIAEAHDE